VWELISDGQVGAASDNNAVGASARFARSGVHGAYGAHVESKNWTKSGGT
jgi:hypothetical protein